MESALSRALGGPLIHGAHQQQWGKGDERWDEESILHSRELKKLEIRMEDLSNGPR